MRRTCQSRGRGATAWVALLGAVALLIAWLASRPGPQSAPGIPSPERVPVTAPAGEMAPTAQPRPVPLTEEPAQDLAKTYDGRGILRGQVQVAEGLQFPEHWQLLLEPARFLEGRERAVRRVVEITGGAREFEVRDLPLGGYEVSARAPGMNGIPEPVLLYAVEGRPDLPGTRYAYLNLWLTPAGFVDGSVVDEDGIPIGQFPIALRRTSDGGLLETLTDPAGNYLFPVVLDDEYEMLFGDPQRPLRPPELFTFQAPSMRYPERTIPATVDVLFRVFDELGHTLGQTSVRGYGHPGATLDLVTDDDGEARAPFLPPGSYRVVAKSVSGQRGKVNFEVRASERTKVVEIVAKP